MPTMQRSRTIAADPRTIWEVIEDPHHLPRWWPKLERVEGVSADRWTEVYLTRKGKPVRMDFRLRESSQLWRRVWEQELAGTPFQRVLSESVTVLRIEPEGQGTRVTIERQQQLRGYSRTGGWMLRRATRKKLDEALAGLQRICA